MFKRIAIFGLFFLTGIGYALAGVVGGEEPTAAPELPATLAPLILLSLAGVTVWLRNFFNRK